MATRPIEQYRFDGICDFDFTDSPVAEFHDGDGYSVNMTLSEVDDAIDFCTKYGLVNDHLKIARKQLLEPQRIYEKMKDPDNIPIQR